MAQRHIDPETEALEAYTRLSKYLTEVLNSTTRLVESDRLNPAERQAMINGLFVTKAAAEDLRVIRHYIFGEYKDCFDCQTSREALDGYPAIKH